MLHDYPELPNETYVNTKFVETWAAGKIRSGVACAFAQVNNLWGIKYYKSWMEAEFNQMMQYYASLHGLAPYVAQKRYVGLDLKYNRPLYGFLTMIADVKEFVGHGWDIPDWSKIPCVMSLRKQLRDSGFKAATVDLHADNVGWFEDRLVCIDFSEMYEHGFVSRENLTN